MNELNGQIASASQCEMYKFLIRLANKIEELKMANTTTDEKLIAMDALVTKVLTEISVEVAFLKSEMQNKGVTDAGMHAIENIEMKLAATDAERPDIAPTEPVAVDTAQPSDPATQEPVTTLDENGNPVA